MTDAAPIRETRAFAIEAQVPPRPSARLRVLMAPLEAFVARCCSACSRSR